MKKLDLFNKIGIYLCFFLLIVLFNGCGKEEYDIHDVPYEELESSFFEYSSDAIVIDYEDLGNIVLEKTENSLVLRKSSLF